MTPWFRVLEHRVGRWTANRSWIDIPVTLALLALFGSVIALLMWRKATVEANYEALIQRSLAQKNFDTAEVASRRLLGRAEGEKGKYLYYLSVAMEGAGKAEEAAMYLDRAAPLDTPGYSFAHVAQARTFLNTPSPGPDAIKKATIHLKHAIQADTKNLGAREILGRLYLLEREWHEAIKCLTPVAKQNPEYIFLIAQAARQSGDMKVFSQWIAEAVQVFSSRVKTAQRVNSRDRVMWATALAAHEQFAQAVEVIEDGIKEMQDAAYGKVLGEIYSTWVTFAASGEPGNLKDQIARICKGIERDPTNEKLLQAAFKMARSEGAEAVPVREAVAQLLASGGNSAILHFMAGNDAWTNGEHEKARTHWELANRLSPLVPAIANNLALALSTGNEVDLNRAIELIDKTIEHAPNDPNFRETRGRILLKLGRAKEAVVDLERALPLLARNSGTHLHLAEAYQKLGMNDLADRHRALAQPTPPPTTPAGKAAEPQKLDIEK